MKFKVGDKVRIRPDLNYIHSSGNLVVVEDMIESRGEVDTIAVVTLDYNDRAEYRLEGHRWIWNDNMLIPESEPVKVIDRVEQRFRAGDKVRLKRGLIDGQTYGSLQYNDLFPQKEYTVKSCDSIDNTYLCTIPDKCELWFSDEMLESANTDGGFCDGFRGGKIPTPSKSVSITDQLDSLADAWSRLGCTSFQMATDVIDKLLKKSEEKKLKFTFHTEEGYRFDKSNNSKVETITTFVKINGFDNTYLGMATCDKVDCSERDGILNAIANAVLGGNFDREYEKFLADKKRKYDESCKCKICGRNYYEDEKTGKRTPFTPEDARKHEEWHEQNRKNKREKYLIHKEAKRRLAEAEREGKIEKVMKELYKK